MASLVMSSSLWGTTFGTNQMRALFSDEAIVQRYLDIEAALARVQSGLGIIPEEAGQAISEACKIENVDWDALASGTGNVGYPIAPLVKQLSGWARDGLGEYCHWGATTQDIMDTADVLQARDGLDLLEADLLRLRNGLATLSEHYCQTPMTGRTHLQHALPIPFGYKTATWLAGLDRHQERLQSLRSRAFILSFFGAVGTLASLGDKGVEVHTALAKELELAPAPVSWHSVRDGFAEITGWLAQLSASIGKIGLDVALMMQTETGEVAEPFKPGRGSSSTMPQKRNPISSELMIAAAKVVREQHSLMLDAMVQDHERATGQWHVEWQAMPTAFLMTSASLSAACDVIEGLEVFPENMRDVLQRSDGLIMAEAVMMGLAPILGRQTAHDVVEECCHASVTEGRELLSVLLDNEAVASAVEPEDLKRLLDPASYFGAAPDMIKHYLAGRGKQDE